MEEKTFVDDINRSVYDIKNEENDSYRIKQGLTPEIVEKISEEKHDPAWMREFRLKSLEIYNIIERKGCKVIQNNNCYYCLT